MQAGTLLESDVQAFTSRITVNGVPRAHVSWKITRELSGDLPAQVTGVSGVKQATAAVEWNDGPDVTDVPVNPWNSSSGWLPQSGDRVVIYAGDGVSEWQQGTFLVDETTGDVGEGYSSTLIDDWDRLTVAMSHEPLASRMPPYAEGGLFRQVGLSARTIVNTAMRFAKFYQLPRHEFQSALSVMCQGSLWPWSGTMTSGAGEQLNHRAAWDYGWAMSDFTTTYNPGMSKSPAGAAQLTVLVAPEHAGSFTIDAWYGTRKLRLWINTGRSAVAFIDNGTGQVEIIRLALGSATAVTFLYKDGHCWLRTNTGANVSGPGTLGGTDQMSSVTLTADADARVAGIQVSFPQSSEQEFASLTHVPDAFVDSSTLIGRLDASPSIIDRPCGEVLDEIGKATLSAMWINELGHLQFVGSDQLRARNPSRTVTTRDDITKLSWSESALGTASRVRVQYKELKVSRSRYSNIKLYQGSGNTAESGQENVDVMVSAADEDWLNVDMFAVGAMADSLARHNKGQGTMGWFHIVHEDESWADVPPGWVSGGLSKQDHKTYTINQDIGTLGAGYSVVIATHEDDTRLVKRFRGMPMPILRGRGKLEWTDASVVSEFPGPPTAPELVHDASYWNSRTSNTTTVVNLADFIAGQVRYVAPVITGLHVDYDPRTQLGDVINIESPNYMGVSLRALIVGVDNTAGDEFSQSLTVRIISVDSAFTTYDQWEEAFPDTLTYTQWYALRSPLDTYDDFNSNPLEGS